MERKFEEIVEAIEESFLERGVSVVKIQRSMKHMRVSLKRQLGDYFQEQIFKPNSVQEMFVFLSSYWDYLNPGLLESLLEGLVLPKHMRVSLKRQLGDYFQEHYSQISITDLDLMTTYLAELKIFRMKVKLGEFVHAHIESRACHHSFCQNIVAVMGGNWGEKSLQDLEDYKNGLANELQLQPFLAQIHAKYSSIAIVFSMPQWIQINFEDLEPFFRSHDAIKVSHEDSCVIDWTRKVIGTCTILSEQC